MEEKKQSYFGQGPKIFRPAFLWAIAAALGAWLWPEVLRISNPAGALSGWILIVLGGALYCWGLKHMVKAVKSGQLDTSGPFSLVRHPMYSAILVFVFPGIALASGAWLIVGSSVVGWLAFRRWAQTEELKLVEIFGQAYQEYRQTTPMLIPFTKANSE